MVGMGARKMNIEKILGIDLIDDNWILITDTAVHVAEDEQVQQVLANASRRESLGLIKVNADD